MEKRLRSIPEVATVLGVSSFTIRRALARGEIKSVRVARRVLIPQAEVERVYENGYGRQEAKSPARA